MLTAYVAGPYSDPRGLYYVEKNIQEARECAVELWGMGIAALCPHLNTYLMDGVLSWERALEGDVELLRRLDVLVLLPRWRKSKGALVEAREAVKAYIPLYYWPDDRRALEVASQTNVLLGQRNRDVSYILQIEG